MSQPLIWQDVAQPNFNSSNQAFNTAAHLIDRGLQRAGDTVEAAQAFEQQNVNTQWTQDMLGAKTGQDVDALLAKAAQDPMMTPKLLKELEDRKNTLYDQNRQRTADTANDAASKILTKWAGPAVSDPEAAIKGALRDARHLPMNLDTRQKFASELRRLALTGPAGRGGGAGGGKGAGTPSQAELAAQKAFEGILSTDKIGAAKIYQMLPEEARPILDKKIKEVDEELYKDIRTPSATFGIVPTSDELSAVKGYDLAEQQRMTFDDQLKKFDQGLGNDERILLSTANDKSGTIEAASRAKIEELNKVLEEKGVNFGDFQSYAKVVYEAAKDKDGNPGITPAAAVAGVVSLLEDDEGIFSIADLSNGLDIRGGNEGKALKELGQRLARVNKVTIPKKEKEKREKIKALEAWNAATELAKEVARLRRVVAEVDPSPARAALLAKKEKRLQERYNLAMKASGIK